MGGLKSGPPVYFGTRLKRNGNELVIFRKRIAGLSAPTLERFVLRARRMIHLRDTVNVLVTNNSELRALNRRFRGADKATDVLSFPAPAQELSKMRRSAGEVAISADIARDNARRMGHTAANEVKILALHGILHLAGFDHEHDDGEMARKEKRLRQQLKLEAGLIERVKIERVQSERAKIERIKMRTGASGRRRRTA
jgi:probable rRNA maturation factor